MNLVKDQATASYLYARKSRTLKEFLELVNEESFREWCRKPDESCEFPSVEIPKLKRQTLLSILLP